MLTNFVQIEREYGFVEREGLTLAEIVDFPTNKNGHLDAVTVVVAFARSGEYAAPCGTRFMTPETLSKPENAWRKKTLHEFTTGNP